MTQILVKNTDQPRFLHGGLFRFSQPGALNDPDEALPRLSVNQYSPEDYEVARQLAAARSRIFPPAISNEQLERDHMRPFLAHTMDEKVCPGLWPAREPRLRPEPFETAEELQYAIAVRAIELTKKLADAEIGIFSLTDAYPNESMWANYAHDHQGVAIKFDPTHPFFRGRLLRVSYSEDPIRVSSNMGLLRLAGHVIQRNDVLNGHISLLPLDLLFRKRTDYRHEQEWRLVENLRASRTRSGPDLRGFDIHLFKIPPDAVVSLVFGRRARAESIQDALRWIESDPSWTHLTVSARRETSFGVHEERLR